MAIWKMRDKPRKLPWRAKAKGQVKNFVSKKDAEYWERTQLQSYTLTGLPLTIEALKKVTVGEIVERYLKEKTPLKGSAPSETPVLEKLLGFTKGARVLSKKRHPICELSLATIKKKDAYEYRDERLRDTWRGKPIAESSVKRQIGILHHIFATAKEEWGYENLANPFDKMKLRDGAGRERRLEDGELERLEHACRACRGLNKFYIPLAISLAIETGMRLQEIFNLTWADVDIRDRRIRITKSKTDYASKYKGRTIVLTYAARWYMMQLAVWAFGKPHKYDGVDWSNAWYKHWQAIFSAKRERIFPMTRDAFKQSWADVVDRAKIQDLHFHDLRHEAGSKFDQAGLTHAEHGLMMGHGKRTMRDLYSHGTLQSIQEKLDKSVFGGLTGEEMQNKLLLDLRSVEVKDDKLLAELRAIPAA